jgi:tetratricopeptide (TPR) repeat protein
MGLFDLFKLKARNKLTQDNQDFAKAMRDDFEQTKKEVEKLQADNASWQKDFDTIINFRRKASSLEKEGKLHEAIEEYSKSVLFGEASLHSNLNNYAHDIDRLFVLYNKTKQKSVLADFLEQLISKYPNYRDAQKWAVRLSSIKDIKPQIGGLKLEDIEKPHPNKPTLGEKYQTFLKTFPKFNFYYDMPEGMNTFEYLSLKKPVPFERSVELRSFKDVFESILNKARLAENENNLKAAIEAYEKLVVEECLDTEPYERLMVIYRKLHWETEERRIIQTAISFFSHLKGEQRKCVLNLAQEFNMVDKALEYINSDKKVFYYGGAFELYNPYVTIEKWKLRMTKLKE